MNGFLRRIFGTQGERAAAKYLKQQGMRILARQHNTRWGELDLIAYDQDTIVFVEVKTRRSDDLGHPSERVDRQKREHLTKAALSYLKRHKLLSHRARFDVVTVVWPEGSREPQIEHFRHAFEAVEFGQFY